MKGKPLTESVAELKEAMGRYINARIGLVQVKLLDKFTKAGTFIITTVIIVIAVSFVLLLLALAFSYWYGERYGSISEGLIISAGFYIVLALLIYLFRKSLISNTIIRECAELFFEHKDKEPEE